MNSKRKPFRFIGDKKFHFTTFTTALCLVSATGIVVLIANLLALMRHGTWLEASLSQTLMNKMILYSLLTTITVLVFAFLITYFSAHKTAGPMYKLETHMEHFLKGDFSRSIKFRNDDEFKNVGDLFERVRLLHVSRFQIAHKEAVELNNHVQNLIDNWPTMIHETPDELVRRLHALQDDLLKIEASLRV